MDNFRGSPPSAGGSSAAARRGVTVGLINRSSRHERRRVGGGRCDSSGRSQSRPTASYTEPVSCVSSVPGWALASSTGIIDIDLSSSTAPRSADRRDRWRGVRAVVGAQVDLFAGRREKLFGGAEQVGDLGVRGAVVDLAALDTVGDEAAFFEAGDVAGDVALRSADRVNEVFDALFAVDECEQDGEPGGFGEPAEQLGGGGDMNSGARRHTPLILLHTDDIGEGSFDPVAVGAGGAS